MKPKVYFASVQPQTLEPQSTLPAKFERLLERHSLRSFVEGKSVAIKMHFGGNIGYTTIHPLFVGILVKAVRNAGGKPFITDGSFSLQGARVRGYTEDVIGCPAMPAAGFNEKYLYRRAVDFNTLKQVEVTGQVADADVLIDFSHVKGHGACGYGGACKNLAMGCVSGKTRADIHHLEGGLTWLEEKCGHCNKCIEACRTGAARFNDEGKLWIFYHHCIYCQHCATACPNKAITLKPGGYKDFQKGMAIATREVLRFFEPASVLYINVLLNITMVCDCWGFSTPSVVPDIGIVSSHDIVAIERASLDMIKVENFIPNSLPKDRSLRDEGRHLFERIHAKDPFVQVDLLEAEGLGSQEYELIEVE